MGTRTSSLLKIGKVRVFGRNGWFEVFAILDEGSAITLIDSNITNQLKLADPTTPICLQWALHLKPAILKRSII